MYIPIEDVKYIMSIMRNLILRGCKKSDVKKCYMILNTNMYIYNKKRKVL